MAGYNNYLIKIGSPAVEIPLSYISLDSFSVTRATQDLDSYRDATGVLHRNVLGHKVGKVEFTTPIITQKNLTALLSLISSNYSDATAKTLAVEAWCIEIGDYLQMTCYVPDITPKIMQNSPLGLIYEPVRIAFIEY